MVSKVIAVALIIFSSTAEARVHYLEKNAPAPEAGFLFPKEEEKALRDTKNNLEVCEDKVEVYKKLRENHTQAEDLLNQRIELYQKHNTSLAEQVIDNKQQTFWNSLIYFGAGVLVTGALSYGVIKYAK